MTTTDHRAEAERIMREHSTYGLPSTEAHLLAAIHDELRAIRGVVPTPKEPDPKDECCDCHLAAVIERDKAIKERDRALATVERVEALVGYYESNETQGWHRHAARDLRAALGGERA